MSIALRLGLVALIGSALLATIHELTRERVAARAHAQALARLAAVLPPELYDNDPLAETRYLADPRLGPGRQRIHTARRDGQVRAVAITASAADGYAGPILFITGIDRDGRILGVRVLEHGETPGLGDPIEERRSDWIHGFAGRRLGDPPATRWTVRRDGGDFDQFTGATITPRALTQAIARVLAFHDERHAELYEPAEADDEPR
ncbi:MAG: electron transport complex subunit RsxG [Xanthomonadales bacterium]|nr:electron transport complex subunit RsxG [Xanthomonadales bacterium]